MSSASKINPLQRILRGTTIYFVIVFGAGFILGPIRILWAVPRFGERNAELMETPFMLVVILFAALTIKRPYAGRPGVALTIGIAALGLLVIAELTAVLRLRGLTFGEYLKSRDPISGAVYVAMLIVFAILPWLVARTTRTSRS